MSALSWISDVALDACVDELISRIRQARNDVESRIKKNVSDPFSLICSAYLFQFENREDLFETQKDASILSGAASAIGDFHQKILGNVSGFTNHDSGYDIKSEGRKILAEVKNKHNTMNSNNREATINNLKVWLKDKSDYTGYLVIIIPKKPKRYKTELAPRLYEVDGATFYTLATGEETALKDLHHVLLHRLCANDSDITAYIKEKYSDSLPE